MQGLANEVVAQEQDEIEQQNNSNEPQQELGGETSPEKNLIDDAEESQQEEQNAGRVDAAEAVVGITEDQERYNSIDQRICGSLMDRLHAFEGLAIQSQTVPEDLIDARIQCLSISKVLVTIHKKNIFLLVTAYAQLGQAYLLAKCFE